jgi:hypothetical protein
VGKIELHVCPLCAIRRIVCALRLSAQFWPNNLEESARLKECFELAACLMVKVLNCSRRRKTLGDEETGFLCDCARVQEGAEKLLLLTT